VLLVLRVIDKIIFIYYKFYKYFINVKLYKGITDYIFLHKCIHFLMNPNKIHGYFLVLIYLILFAYLKVYIL